MEPDIASKPAVLAWHGDPDLKAEAVQRMKVHQAQDAFIQGAYFMTDTETNQFQGCFHGCLTTEKYMEEKDISLNELNAQLLGDDGDGQVGPWHWQQGERIWGIPADLGWLLDMMFEGHDSSEDAGKFAVEVTEAIPVGADLSDVPAAYRLLVRTPNWNGVEAMLELLRNAPVPQDQEPDDTGR